MFDGIADERGLARGGNCSTLWSGLFFLELVLSSLRAGSMRFPTGDVIVGWEVTVLSLFSRSTEWWVVKGFSCDLGLVLGPTEYSRKE